jgi:hypothetical protein
MIDFLFNLIADLFLAIGLKPLGAIYDFIYEGIVDKVTTWVSNNKQWGHNISVLISVFLIILVCILLLFIGGFFWYFLSGAV